MVGQVAVVISLNTHRMPGNHCMRGHTHNSVMLMVVSDGVLEEAVDGRVETIGFGAARLSPAGAAHDLYFFEGGAVCTLIEGRGPFWSRVLSRPLSGRSAFARVGVCEVAALAAADNRSLLASRRMLSSLCRAIASFSCVDLGAPPAWLAEAQNALARADDNRVAAISAALGRNRTHFARAFTSHVGLTPQEFRAIRRFSSAFDALVEDSPLAEIALACGYAHQSHMNNAFRALCGLTPADVRKRGTQQSCNTAG